jgi:hypothetical protein
MILPIIKENINKIDHELKQLFENVYISDKSQKNNFLFHISCNKMFLFEGCKKRVEVIVDINKEDLKSNNIKWSYSLNPLNENAERIERYSTINNIAKDIYDIADNRRMVNEYFNSLEAHVDLINESANVETTDIDTTNLLATIVSKYSKDIKYVANLYTEKNIYFILKEKLSMSNMFRLEKDLLDSGKVNSVSFTDGNIKVNF